MSEEFDKEAEKEKLRRQLAEEEQSRESTRHMSELLLKGATMTNRHCDTCGDPLFRHEGREFCPTCGGEDADGDRAVADGAAGQTPDDGGTAAEARDPSTDPVTPTESSGTTGQAGPDSSGGTAPTGTGVQADLAAAREALVRKVTELAREAEASTDVGRTSELLAAVREGAQALRALEEADR